MATIQKIILVIEDEIPIREMLQFILAQAGFTVKEASDGKQAMHFLAEQIPDLILLDWMLPGMSGIEIARQLKKNQRTTNIPLILLTARASEDNKVKGLETGADDYITKPFSPRELIARIQAVLRRTSPTAEYLEANGLRIDLAAHRVSLQGKFIQIGPKEYQLLHFFMCHPQRVYSREQLLNRVWKNPLEIDERSVDVCIRRLRKALSPTHQHLIETVRGSGYRFATSK